MHVNALFERITAQIIAGIESGLGRYEMPWHRWGNTLNQPINAITGRPYRGANVLQLWFAAELERSSCGRWATLRQWSAAGGKVRKSERATPVIFWKTTRASSDKPDKEADRSPRLIGRCYHLFNEAQVENVQSREQESRLSPDQRFAASESFIAALGADIRPGGDRAFYSPASDQICLPNFEQFRDPLSYYAVASHELVHWSGAKHRLDRELGGRFGAQSYAAEELVAEIGAAFIAAQLGLSLEPREDHARYVNSWLQVLRSDSRAILTAAAKAQEAVDYLVGLSDQDRHEGDEISRLVAA
jgi:antirestriction protein ArdC